MRNLKGYKINGSLEGGGWKEELRKFRMRRAAAEDDEDEEAEDMPDLFNMTKAREYFAKAAEKYEKRKIHERGQMNIQRSRIEEQKREVKKAIQRYRKAVGLSNIRFMDVKAREAEIMLGSMERKLQEATDRHEAARKKRNEFNDKAIELEKKMKSFKKATVGRSDGPVTAESYEVDYDPSVSVIRIEDERVADRSQEEIGIEVNMEYNNFRTSLKKLTTKNRINSPKKIDESQIEQLNKHYKKLLRIISFLDRMVAFNATMQLDNMKSELLNMREVGQNRPLPEHIIRRIFSTHTLITSDTDQKNSERIAQLETYIQQDNRRLRQADQQESLEEIRARILEHEAELEELRNRMSGSGKPTRKLKGYRINI